MDALSSRLRFLELPEDEGLGPVSLAGGDGGNVGDSGRFCLISAKN
jgi:hypothetical protein